MDQPIRNSITRIMNEYLTAKTEQFKQHPFANFVRRDIPQIFYELPFLDRSNYTVNASSGSSGNWAYVPWIAIMNKKITTSTQRGYYIVYLFSEDMKSVFLTMGVGVTETTREQIDLIKHNIRSSIKEKSNFNKDDNIYLGESKRAKDYAHSTAIYMKYSKDNIPSEEQLQEDLKDILQIYEEYINIDMNEKAENRKKNKWFLNKIIEAMTNLGGSGSLQEIYNYIDEKYGVELIVYKDWPAKVGQLIYMHSSDADKVFAGSPGDESDLFYAVEGKGKGVWGLRNFDESLFTSEIIEEEFEEFISYKELVSHIHDYIQSKGFLYSLTEVTNLFLSVKTKPFVILSGISGTGKTKIVQWFAESIGATENNGQFTLIPVRPDWNDGSDLLGYVDIKGDFKEGPLTKVIKKATREPNKPFIVLLDEMNLARVEYYFSDILSVMESRKWQDDKIVSSKLLSKETANFDLLLPNNVYIFGTVNMDETTYPFSKKVLDRANTIEFNQVDLHNLDYLSTLNNIVSKKTSNEFLASTYLHLKDLYAVNPNIIKKVTEELVKINAILEPMYAHVGYRVRDEICFYLAYNEEVGLLEFNEAFDHAILQKILPRLSGSDSRIDRVLQDLYRLFTNKVYDESLENKQQDIVTAKYPKSAKKVLEMIRRLKEDGFTSFWIS